MHISATFSRDIVSSEGTRDSFSKSLKDAKLQYKVRKMPVILDLHDATDVAQSVMHEFNARRKVFTSVMMIIKRYSRNVDDSRNKWIWLSSFSLE